MQQLCNGSAAQAWENVDTGWNAPRNEPNEPMIYERNIPMRKSPLLTVLGSIAALAMLILAFPTSASAANPAQISNPMQSVCLQPIGGSVSTGVLIQQATCDGLKPEQRWTRSGLHYVNNGSGLCLDAAGPAIVGHIQTIQRTCSTSSSQNWVPESSVPGAVTSLKSQLSGNRCLERAGGAWVGNGAWLSPCNGTLDQQWLIPF